MTLFYVVFAGIPLLQVKIFKVTWQKEWAQAKENYAYASQ